MRTTIFPREREGERKFRSHVKVNKEVVLRENDSILCYVCLHSLRAIPNYV